MPDRLQAEKVDGFEKPMIIPNERVLGKGVLKVVSTGMLVEDEGTALMWRGLMLTKAVEQFLNDVHWGHLDYLLIDMPPGTGDVQMGLARMLPRTDLVIVTTPAVSAQKVAIRAADMAQRSFLRVAGVIENLNATTATLMRYSAQVEALLSPMKLVPSYWVKFLLRQQLHWVATPENPLHCTTPEKQQLNFTTLPANSLHKQSPSQKCRGAAHA
jgi:hypothetical protein